MNKRILIITPKFPYPAYGACEQDRLAGIEWFIAQGYGVFVVTKVYDEEYKAGVEATAKRLGIPIVAVSYKNRMRRSWTDTVVRFMKRLAQPWYWDGAAFEYADPEMKAAVEQAITVFKPDFAWVDYTYLWPLYRLLRRKKIPIITRSINFEPRHFLDESGRTIFNYFKFATKVLTEFLTARYSTVLAAITPDEARAYAHITNKPVLTLPLRALPGYLDRERSYIDKRPLNVFFFGSTYSVAHNRAALEFLLTAIIPLAQQQFPQQFNFHIFGKKIPAIFERYFSPTVFRHNYVAPEEFEIVLRTMDIAIIPSLYGAGMQQKIFEPLCRAIPVIVSPRGLAGYPFEAGKHVLTAVTAREFVAALGELRDATRRVELGKASQDEARTLFSQGTFDTTLQTILSAARAGV